MTPSDTPSPTPRGGLLPAPWGPIHAVLVVVMVIYGVAWEAAWDPIREGSLLERLTLPLLLYVGETARAEQRWKGEHDCKAYLAAYGDALHKAGLSSRLSICFWSDVPTETRARRRLERALIQRWQPPFNKETRGRWATPFQTEPG